MKNSKLFNVAGSKERLFEMMQKVNKISLNEDVMQGEAKGDLAANAFNELVSGALKIDKTNTQTDENGSYLEIGGVDDAGNRASFRFRVEGSQGDQDGVFSVNKATLTQFNFVGHGFDAEMGEEVNTIQRLNASKSQEMIDVASQYADFDMGEPEIDEEYMQAMQKIDSYPFGGTPRTMVTPAQYLDQKPTNPDLRVKAPELNKFVVGENNIVMDNPDTANLGQHYYDKSKSKFQVIEQAIEAVNKILAVRGQNSTSIPIEQYRKMVKDEASIIYADFLGRMNEGKKKKKDKTDYPNPIGSHFKPKSDYPTEKKKPQTAVNIDEEFGDEEKAPNMNLRDTQPNLKMAKNAANSDMDKEHRGVNRAHSGINKVPYDTQFGEFDLHEKEEPNAGEEQEINHVEREREEQGEKLQGGLGDEATTQQFDQEQVLMGLKVEMEHSDDPTVALEIVLDHLSEDPEYYTTKDNPECSAQANAAKDAEGDEEANPDLYGAGSEDQNDVEKENPDLYPEGWKEMDGMFMNPNNPMYMGGNKKNDKEEEDILLGFKPHNVGDEIEEAYGQANPLKIPAFPKAGTVK